MKKIFLLISLCIVANGQVFGQFIGSLAGYPLVTTGWLYGGDATVVDSTIQLTPPTTTQAGYVYYNTVVNLTTCAQFTVKFDFRIIESGFSTVADGIAFWYISNPPSGFITGGGIGLPSNPDGLMLILDTYDNDGNGNNPLETLVGYTGSTAGYTEGAATGVLAPVVPNQNFIDDGSWHHCELDYNAGNITVYFNNSATPSITAYYPMSIAGYFGFSSSTGAAYSTQSVKDVYISAAGISTVPTVTSPVSYCQYAAAAPLTATGTGGTLNWFTTDTATVAALPGAPTPATNVLDTTTYYVRQGSGTCISAPDSIQVIIKPIPAPPVISGDTSYCTGATALPLTATGTGAVKWYDVRSGGASTTIAPTVSTAVPGRHNYYASETVGGCESLRDSIHIAVYTTPPPPALTSGGLAYCQYVPVVPLVISGTNVLWYSSPSGGTGSPATPTVSTATAGTYNYYATQTDSGCTSTRTDITVQVHPKPSPPVVHPQPWCQFVFSTPVSATVSAAGDNLLWYGPGHTAGLTLAPTPPTAAAPDTINYYVTETSSFGCVSDSARDAEIIIKLPAPPVTHDIWYCQQAVAAPLNAEVDSATSSSLKWYFNGTLLPATPVPSTDTTPGNTTWYVTQTVNTCQSDSATVTVTLLYKPVFGITASQPSVCQFDSISINYNGPQLVAPSYTWTLPEGASFAAGTHVYDSAIQVNFDSAVLYNYVKLTVSDDSGKCTSDTSIRINIVSQPTVYAYTKPDVCLGDTVELGLAAMGGNSSTYAWNIDYISMVNSSAITIIRTNSNSGGPFSVAWVDSGRHIIEVQSFTGEGCRSEPSYDTINVHAIPDAKFAITSENTGGCIGDSVQFTAETQDYNNAYEWTPEQSFQNINKPVAWGTVTAAATITLTVTDPFGCVATESMNIEPGACCTVGLPNAFTPNGDAKNDFFRPLYNGYHHFHVFQIANRWGQVVFNSENSGMQWDGTYNGVPQDMGTYYYYLKYDCGGKTFEQKGDLTLIR